MAILRPKTNLLDNNYKDKIFAESKKILNELGVLIENQEASKILSSHGIPSEGQRFFLSEDIIESSLKTAPKEIFLYDREGKSKLNLKDDNFHFDPGSAAINILDENTGIIREAVIDDFIKFSKIVGHLEHIDAQSTAIICKDVPKDAQDWHRLYVALNNCHKPVITGTFRKESFEIMKQLLLVFRTSEKDLADKPLAIFDAAPSPPLKWSDLIAQTLVDAAKSMIPSELVSMPLAGANAPMNLIGAITQHCAESLAGVVITQLTNQGAPVIWGGSPAVMDMKYATTPMGAIETVMINLGDIEMGKHFNLPTHAYMALSDAKVPDAQSGIEASTGAMMAALAGVNVISGPGMLNFESTQSIEKLVIDNDIAGMVKRFVRGIEDYGSPFAYDILKDYDQKEELLSHPTTLKLFRKELFFPSPVIDRRPHESWEKSGSLSARKRAKSRVLELVNKEVPHPIDSNLKEELDRVLNQYL